MDFGSINSVLEPQKLALKFSWIGYPNFSRTSLVIAVGSASPFYLLVKGRKEGRATSIKI